MGGGGSVGHVGGVGGVGGLKLTTRTGLHSSV